MYSRYLTDWPDTIEKSPYTWYSNCLVYNASSFEMVQSLNGVRVYEAEDRVHLEDTVITLDTPIQVK
jgi:hypothetical protein